MDLLHMSSRYTHSFKVIGWRRGAFDFGDEFDTSLTLP